MGEDSYLDSYWEDRCEMDPRDEADYGSLFRDNNDEEEGDRSEDSFEGGYEEEQGWPYNCVDYSDDAEALESVYGPEE